MELERCSRVGGGACVCVCVCVLNCGCREKKCGCCALGDVNAKV